MWYSFTSVLQLVQNLYPLKRNCNNPLFYTGWQKHFLGIQLLSPLTYLTLWAAACLLSGSEIESSLPLNYMDSTLSDNSHQYSLRPMRVTAAPERIPLFQSAMSRGTCVLVQYTVVNVTLFKLYYLNILFFDSQICVTLHVEVTRADGKWQATIVR